MVGISTTTSDHTSLAFTREGISHFESVRAAYTSALSRMRTPKASFHPRAWKFAFGVGFGIPKCS